MSSYFLFRHFEKSFSCVLYGGNFNVFGMLFVIYADELCFFAAERLFFCVVNPTVGRGFGFLGNVTDGLFGGMEGLHCVLVWSILWGCGELGIPEDGFPPSRE